MRLHLRLIAVLVVAAGLVGAVLAFTVLNTDESSSVADPGTTGSTGTTVTGETGSTLDYAQPIPLPIEGPMLGVNMTAYTSDGYSKPSVRRAMKTLADLGSTAVTLVPALADDAEHVTMLQRSPTYIATLPARDPLADLLRRVLILNVFAKPARPPAAG